LAVIDPESMSIRPVRRADGAPLVDYFFAGGATTPQGEVLFSAMGGMTVVRAGVLPPWRFKPPIVITDLRVGGKPVPAGPFNGMGAKSTVTLTPDANSLAVEFAALDFTAPERNRHAYRLDGFDRDWVETDTSRRLAVFANLSPGEYTLRLRGSNRDGLWTGQDLALPIRVLPAWHQRLEVRILAAIMLIIGVFGLIRWRTSYLRRRQGELERQVDDQTADLRAANERLARLAMTDLLTGCATRRHFLDRAADLIAQANRQGTPLSLAVLDLDDFKRINDSHGHPVGDAVLAKAGHVLIGHMRAADLIGRMGGEEFALLMPDTAGDGAYLLADRLRLAIGQSRTEIDGAEIGVTISLGVAERRQGEGFDSLYARADAALYFAKQNGRNQVRAAAG
jgi:diguanylate cyclase (GGDEF)-like protein